MKPTMFVVVSAMLLCDISCAPVDAAIDTELEPSGLAPPAEGKGIQIRMTETVPGGVESYRCKLVQVPPEGFAVHGEDVQFGVGAHHVLLYRTPYKAIPTQDERGTPLDPTLEHDCSDGVTARWKVDAVVGGSETFGDRGILAELPDGVALSLAPNTVLVMSTHYLNAGNQPRSVDARVNLYTMPKEDVLIEAGILYLNNQVLSVPPMGESTARMRCPVPSDVSVLNLQSHMHGRGVSFRADVQDKGGVLQELYTTTRFQEPPVRWFDPALSLHAGDFLFIRCDYQSHEARSITEGATSRDEMCQLIGPYFPRDERLEACQDKNGDDDAVWIGSGEKDGAGTLDCLREALAAEGRQGYRYRDCLRQSCEAIADDVSAVMRCHQKSWDGLCAPACVGAPSSMCVSCLAEACGVEEGAAVGAGCL